MTSHGGAGHHGATSCLPAYAGTLLAIPWLPQIKLIWSPSASIRIYHLDQAARFGRDGPADEAARVEGYVLGLGSRAKTGADVGRVTWDGTMVQICSNWTLDSTCATRQSFKGGSMGESLMGRSNNCGIVIYWRGPYIIVQTNAIKVPFPDPSPHPPPPPPPLHHPRPWRHRAPPKFLSLCAPAEWEQQVQPASLWYICHWYICISVLILYSHCLYRKYIWKYKHIYFTTIPNHPIQAKVSIASPVQQLAPWPSTRAVEPWPGINSEVPEFTLLQVLCRKIPSI